MTLDQAIDRYTNNAEYERIHGSLQGCLDFRQLAEWLKDYKRLLEQQPCDKCVYSTKDGYCQYDDITETIPPLKPCDEFESITPEEMQKYGKWILTIEDWNKWTCSKCGYVKRTDIHVNIGWKLCPNCGAKMQESED